MKRRDFIKFFTGLTLLATVSPCLKISRAFAEKNIDKINLSDGEWKNKLTEQQYNILREAGTERAFTSELLEEHREGIFACVGCELPLFPSEFKYNSGTGWPSFFDAIPGHLETKTDHELLYPRTEYHCARCGGHHGHVFDDGPKPTGMRYCNNGAVLKFIPKGDAHA